MIRSVLAMKPKPGRAGDVVELFQQEQIIEKALTVDGCHDVSVLKRDTDILVTATWSDAAAYQRWIDHPERNSSSDELNALLVDAITAESVGGLYDVALTRSAEGSD